MYCVQGANGGIYQMIFRYGRLYMSSLGCTVETQRMLKKNEQTKCKAAQ